MDKIDSLIKTLTEFKEELNKNMNCAPGTDPNMGKADTVIPDKGHGKITIKDTTPKPADPANPHGKIIMKDEDMEKDAKNPALAPKEVKIKKLQAQIDSGTYKPDASKIADKMLKEELTCAENGQWNLKLKD